MLTISSVAVSPLPQQAPTARAQAVPPVKQSKTASAENAGASVVVAPSGDGGRAVSVYTPSALPPVNPTGEAARAEVPKNAAVPEQSGVRDTAGQPGAEPSNTEANTAAVRAEDEQVRRTETRRADNAPTPAETQRYQGQLPTEVKSPVDEAMDTQIKELLPNMWKASRAAVDVLIGEEARAAAAARAEALAPLPEVPTERALEATENYVRTAASEGPSPGSTLNQRV